MRRRPSSSRPDFLCFWYCVGELFEQTVQALVGLSASCEADHSTLSSGTSSVPFGFAASFLPSAFLRLFLVGVFALGSTAAAFSSETRLGATPERAALSAISPSLVVGTYAPPVNLCPHRPQSHIPTDSRLTALMWHWGHSCGALRAVITVE